MKEKKGERRGGKERKKQREGPFGEKNKGYSGRTTHGIQLRVGKPLSFLSFGSYMLKSSRGGMTCFLNTYFFTLKYIPIPCISIKCETMNEFLIK